MKKLFLICSVVFVVLSITACKSKDEVVKQNENAEIPAENKVEAPVETEADAGPKSKNYVGWVDKSSRDVVFKSGIIQIKVKPSLGTFTMGILNDKMKVIPALASAEEFTTNALYLKTSKKIYRLINENGISTGVTRKKNGLCLVYNVPKVADVRVNFDCFATESDIDNDMMKVTVSVTNVGTKKEDFAFKSVFDTVLGEKGKYHFYSSENLPIKNEVCYRTMQNQKWFTSKNENAAMQFIFEGAECSPVEMVAVANYSTFQRLSWEPEMTTYRSFDNVLSYNNSAVGAIWPVVKLKPGESNKMVFYISFASDGKTPAGDKFVKGVDEPLKAKSVEPVKVEEAVQEPAPQVIEESKAEEVVEVKKQKPNLSKEQLTPLYIQNLIDRITALEKSGEKVDSEEIKQLNAELDAILEYLRQ